jgi:hypothetical protein
MCSKYYNYKQLILPLKMANRFIPYVPKPTSEKHSSKPHCKGGRQIERSSVLVKACPVRIDLHTQEAKRVNENVVEGTLPQLNV